METVEEKKQEKSSSVEKAILIFVVLGLVLSVFNQFQLFSLKSGTPIPTGMAIATAAVIPSGIPEIYGSELGIRYDDINPNNPSLADKTIEILANYDRTTNLQGANLERYISIASQMSCEYCCGAQSIIVRREDVEAMDEKIEAALAAGQITEAQAKSYRTTAGTAACGCAHSYAMRGLAKYLITEHGTEFSDEQILEELAKWKTLFFPGPMSAKAEVLKQKDIAFSYASLGSNAYRGIEQGASSGSSGMVGGC